MCTHLKKKNLERIQEIHNKNSVCWYIKALDDCVRHLFSRLYWNDSIRSEVKCISVPNHRFMTWALGCYPVYFEGPSDLFCCRSNTPFIAALFNRAQCQLDPIISKHGLLRHIFQISGSDSSECVLWRCETPHCTVWYISNVLACKEENG